MSTETRNLFIIEHTYYDFNSSNLSTEGIEKIDTVMDFIKSCFDDKKVSLFFEPNQKWIHQSATLSAKSLGVIAEEALNLNSYNMDNGNARKMIGLINSKNCGENVVLITSNRGVMDLIREFKKTYPGAMSFYRNLDLELLNKLKNGRLSFVGFPNRDIEAHMFRIPVKVLTPINTKVSMV